MNERWPSANEALDQFSITEQCLHFTSHITPSRSDRRLNLLASNFHRRWRLQLGKAQSRDLACRYRFASHVVAFAADTNLVPVSIDQLVCLKSCRIRHRAFPSVERVSTIPNDAACLTTHRSGTRLAAMPWSPLSQTRQRPAVQTQECLRISGLAVSAGRAASSARNKRSTGTCTLAKANSLPACPWKETQTLMRALPMASSPGKSLCRPHLSQRIGLLL